MSATLLEIVEKVKPYEVVPAQLENFVTRAGETVPAQTILDNPNISLYCLDDPNQRAIFVETPPGVDLTLAPFYYAAQYEHAQRLIAMPYATFHALAGDVPECDYIMLHSIGRCGSTVISQAFATVPGVLSLSEPDVYTQIYLMRYADQTRDADYTQLLASSTRILGKDTPILAIKFRGMCIHLGDLLFQAFPQSKNIFLYRHQEAWSRSMGMESVPLEERLLPSADVPFYRRAIATLAADFVERHGRETSRMEMSALMWLSLMDSYVKLVNQGMPFLAARYEDIKSEPKRVLAAIFAYCGLTADVETAHTVFAKDAQAGTALSRASMQERVVAPLNAEDYAQMHAVLREHPIIQAADFVAPGTI